MGGKGKSKGKGKNKSAKDGDEGSKPTELHTAAKEGDMDKIASIVADETKLKEQLNASDQHKRTPLHMACFFGKSSAVQKLLDCQADVQKEAMDGYLPMHFAAQNGHVEVARLLTRKVGEGKHGAVKSHVNRVVTKGKRSALHLALQKGHVECARFLVSKGASTSAKTGNGQSALDLCQSPELRKELGGAEVAAAEEEAGANDVDEPAQKRPRTDEVLDDLPDQPPPAEALVIPGVLACGPFRLDSVHIACGDGERSYPAGVGALANVHWSKVSKNDATLIDGPVHCINSHSIAKDANDVRTLRLKVIRSNYRFTEYTNFSDEGKLLPASARCNHCGVMFLIETSDCHLVLAKRSADAKSAPGRWHGWPAGRLDRIDLLTILKEWITEDLGFDSTAFNRLRVLALLEAGAEPLEGRAQELVVSLSLRRTASDVQKSFDRRRGVVLASAPVGAKAQKACEAAAAALPESIAFVPAPGSTPASSLAADLKVLNFDQLLEGSCDEKLTDACKKSFELVRAISKAAM